MLTIYNIIIYSVFSLALIACALITVKALFKSDQDKQIAKTDLSHLTDVSRVVVERLEQGGKNPQHDMNDCILFLAQELGEAGAVLFYGQYKKVNMDVASSHVKCILSDYGYRMILGRY